ncbi:MAG: MoaD/ThiS family protein [Candidatus Melainabacteria bacterium]|nr:MoaD/ThiS family protein [Candidatus Melainabacteria bacterium]
MKVYIPSPLRSYTNKANLVEGEGASISEILGNLDKAFPGIKFRMIDEHGRIREHIKLFINEDEAKNLTVSVSGGETVHIICALSGG